MYNEFEGIVYYLTFTQTYLCYYYVAI